MSRSVFCITACVAISALAACSGPGLDVRETAFFYEGRTQDENGVLVPGSEFSDQHPGIVVSRGIGHLGLEDRGLAIQAAERYCAARRGNLALLRDEDGEPLELFGGRVWHFAASC